jgi:hypothetical protein
MDVAKNIPNVSVWADPDPRGWQLIVASCPFCGQRHIHGGGEVELPPTYGVKTPHCAIDRRYNLVPSSEYF